MSGLFTGGSLGPSNFKGSQGNRPVAAASKKLSITFRTVLLIGISE